jgi:hypothetical protein
MEFRQFASDINRKLMQARADAGDIAGWAQLRSVFPAGADARCDYISVLRFAGVPPEPRGPEGLEKALKQSGLNMTAAEFISKRSSLTSLVSQELWQTMIRVSAPQEGDYLYVNFMKVPNMAAYAQLEENIWKPMAEAWVKEGAMRAWIVNRAVLPGGAEVPYGAVSVDVFPSWEAVFKPLGMRDMFAKVHPGKDYTQTFEKLPEIRTLARRELYVVEHSVTPAKKVSQR